MPNVILADIDSAADIIKAIHEHFAKYFAVHLDKLKSHPQAASSPGYHLTDDEFRAKLMEVLESEDAKISVIRKKEYPHWACNTMLLNILDVVLVQHRAMLAHFPFLEQNKYYLPPFKLSDRLRGYFNGEFNSEYQPLEGNSLYERYTAAGEEYIAMFRNAVATMEMKIRKFPPVRNTIDDFDSIKLEIEQRIAYLASQFRYLYPTGSKMAITIDHWKRNWYNFKITFDTILAGEKLMNKLLMLDFVMFHTDMTTDAYING